MSLTEIQRNFQAPDGTTAEVYQSSKAPTWIVRILRKGFDTQEEAVEWLRSMFDDKDVIVGRKPAGIDPQEIIDERDARHLPAADHDREE